MDHRSKYISVLHGLSQECRESPEQWKMITIITVHSCSIVTAGPDVYYSTVFDTDFTVPINHGLSRFSLHSLVTTSVSCLCTLSHFPYFTLEKHTSRGKQSISAPPIRHTHCSLTKKSENGIRFGHECQKNIWLTHSVDPLLFHSSHTTQLFSSTTLFLDKTYLQWRAIGCFACFNHPLYTLVNIWNGSKPFIKVVLKPTTEWVLVLGQLWTVLIHFKCWLL